MNAHELGQLRHHELLTLVFERHWPGDQRGLLMARMSREQLIALLLPAKEVPDGRDHLGLT